MTPIFLTSAQVADAIGLVSADAFLRQRERLERDTLFPAPMPTQRRPLRWKAAEVSAWIDRMGKPIAPGTSAQDAAHGKPELLNKARSA